MSDGIEVLRKCELFESLDDELLSELLAQGEIRDYKSGDVVFAEMAESDELYMVVEGQLKLVIALLDSDMPGYETELGPGDVCNAVRFIAKGPSYVSCVVETDAKVMVWPADPSIEFWDKHPEAGYEVVKGIARTLYRNLQQFNQIILDRVSWGLE